MHTADLEDSGPTSFSIIGNVLQSRSSTEESRKDFKALSCSKECSAIYMQDNVTPSVTDDPWSVVNADVDADFDVKFSYPPLGSRI